MNVDEIIARAAPPPERADPDVFETVATDEESFARRRMKLVKAFGSEARLAEHAETLGFTTDAWLNRFRDVRLVGSMPDWACTFHALFEQLDEGSAKAIDIARHWIQTELEAAWPKNLLRAPDAFEGVLDYLTGRLYQGSSATFYVERKLSPATLTWADRFRRNPALAYIFGQVITDCRTDMLLIFRRIAADYSVFSREFFGNENIGALVGISAGLGDPHAGGKSVAILRFERGEVVYKPKDLRITTAVGEIIRQLDEPGLVPPETLNRDGYAWEPMYQQSPLARQSDAASFFGALGSWLALLQVLGGNDFWFDNLIADGAIPRFIDFETVTQPAWRWPDDVRPLLNPGAALLKTAPTGTGILPSLVPVRDGQDATDIGCLARPGVHNTPLPSSDQEEVVTWSEDRFAPHDPSGVPMDAADHFDFFEDGYIRVIRKFSSPVLQGDVIRALQKVATSTVRIIRMDTWTCYRAINRSCIPRFLADGVWREIELHAVLPEQSGKIQGEIREAAVRDMRRLDVPLFQTTLDSLDLFGVDGERQPDFFEANVISTVQDRVQTITKLAEDESKAWLYSGFGMRTGNPAWRRPTRASLPPASAADLLAWADEIASDIVRLAITAGNGAPTWIGLMHDVFNGWQGLGSLTFDVLTGRAGLALALFKLARSLTRPDLAALACETLVGAGQDYIEYLDMCLPLGAGYVVGGGGLITTLVQESELRPQARQVFDAASGKKIWMQSGEDFISGLAGWREAARTLDEPMPSSHGKGRPYAPSAKVRLKRWLEPKHNVPLCPSPRAAACLRRDRDRHGSWFAAKWIDDRHNLSGIDGVSALALDFVRLAKTAGN